MYIVRIVLLKMYKSLKRVKLITNLSHDGLLNTCGLSCDFEQMVCI